MSDAERAAAAMVGCWYGDTGAEVGDLVLVQEHVGGGRVRALCLWESGGEDTLVVSGRLLRSACVRVA